MRAQAVTMPCAKYLISKHTFLCGMQLCYFCVEDEVKVVEVYNTTNLMAHGSWWLLVGCMLLLQGFFHSCAVYKAKAAKH